MGNPQVDQSNCRLARESKDETTLLEMIYLILRNYFFYVALPFKEYTQPLTVI